MTTARQDILAAQLRTALTKQERRAAVREFEAGQMPAEDVRAASAFRSWLATPGESRAASEATTTAGGFLVPTRWNAELIRQVREYSGLLNAFELWLSGHGGPANRPVALPQAAGATIAENVAWTAGPDAVLAQQAWGRAPTYQASTLVSNQVIQDAFRAAVTPDGGVGGYTVLPAGDAQWKYGQPVPAPVVNGRASPTLDDMIRSLLAEAHGRVLAPVASAALYAMVNGVGATSGQNGGYITLAAATSVNYITGTASTELIQNTINIDTAAVMFAALDVAYLDGAAYYMSSQQWTNLIRQVDAQKHLQIDPGLGLKLFDFPVVLTSQTSAATASTVSGPVFGNLAAAMTLRIADGGTVLLRSTERFAEWAQTYFRASLRADVATRDARAVVGVKYALT